MELLLLLLLLHVVALMTIRHLLGSGRLVVVARRQSAHRLLPVRLAARNTDRQILVGLLEALHGLVRRVHQAGALDCGRVLAAHTWRQVAAVCALLARSDGQIDASDVPRWPTCWRRRGRHCCCRVGRRARVELTRAALLCGAVLKRWLAT